MTTMTVYTVLPVSHTHEPSIQTLTSSPPQEICVLRHPPTPLQSGCTSVELAKRLPRARGASRSSSRGAGSTSQATLTGLPSLVDHFGSVAPNSSRTCRTPVATSCAQGAEGGRESAGAVGLMAWRATCGGGFGMMVEEFRRFWAWQRTIHWCPLLPVAMSTTLDEQRLWWPLIGRVEVSPSVIA